MKILLKLQQFVMKNIFLTIHKVKKNESKKKSLAAL